MSHSRRQQFSVYEFVCDLCIKRTRNVDVCISGNLISGHLVHIWIEFDNEESKLNADFRFNISVSIVTSERLKDTEMAVRLPTRGKTLFSSAEVPDRQ